MLMRQFFVTPFAIFTVLFGCACSSSHGGTSDIDGGAGRDASVDLGSGDASSTSDAGGSLCMPALEIPIRVTVETALGLEANCEGPTVSGELQELVADEEMDGVRFRIGVGMGDPGFDFACYLHVSNVGTDLADHIAGLGAVVHATFTDTSLLITTDAVCDCVSCACGFGFQFFASDQTLGASNEPAAEFSFTHGDTVCHDSMSPHPVSVFNVDMHGGWGVPSTTTIASAREGQTVTSAVYDFIRLRTVRSHVLDAPPSQSAAWVAWKESVDG
ncbi:MAG: hypothetical protein IPK60_17665 [Sandaracinaceae bacterium]|nr:hypothetical protein [Sandaracinaceae bacterium]